MNEIENLKETIRALEESLKEADSTLIELYRQMKNNGLELDKTHILDQIAIWLEVQVGDNKGPINE